MDKRRCSDACSAGQGFFFNGVPGTTMMNNTNPAIGATSPQMTSGPADIASTGYGNYNAGFASLKMALIGCAMSAGESIAVATWYSKG